MTAIILKTAPHEDKYIVWSTSTDTHEFYGDENELKKFLSFYHKRKLQDIEDRLKRVKRTGTDSEDSSYGGYEDTGFVVQSSMYPYDYPADPFRWVSRKEIGAMVQALQNQEWDLAYQITQPCCK